MEVRELRPSDHTAWQRLRVALWEFQGLPAEDHEAELREILAEPEKNGVFVADREGAIVGFIEVSIRPWAEGCATRPVGYVEAWYVDPSVRGSGIGRRLLDAGESWAGARGCREIASDALLDNELSQQAHLAVGFREVERTVAYAKNLSPRRENGKR